MKVSDVMSRQVEYVDVNTTVKDICRIIFGGGINGVPVCEGKKIVGFITERDILKKFYPSMQEFIEDPVHSADFEKMEEGVSEILNLSAVNVMSREPATISPDAPLLKAQSLMFVEKIGRLPVVDKDKNLVGILSKGDIFKAIVGGQLAYVEDEEYHDWLSKRYDLVTKWETRLSYEVPDLSSFFRQEKVKKIVDIGAGTGEHAIALAKKGFEVVGLEKSKLMYKASKEKWENQPDRVKTKVEFVNGNYTQILSQRIGEFDAAIFMGNALSHNALDYREVLAAVSKSLLPKNAYMIIQMVNFQKVLSVNNRLQSFNIIKAKRESGHEHAFVEFYDPPRKAGGLLTLNMALLHFSGRRWTPRGLNSTPIANINMDNIDKLLRKFGFKKNSFYGGRLWGPLFTHSFKPLESDWLNIIAER